MRLPEELVAEADALAASEGVTRTAVIQAALELLLRLRRGDGAEWRVADPAEATE